jgi:hypothetical protein
MGVPILIVVWDNPSAKFFVEAGIVFVTALAVLLLIFTPKVLAIRSERIEKAQEEKRGAYNKFQARARSDNYDDDDSEEDAKAIAASAGVLAAGAQVDDASKFAAKDSSSTAGATNSSEFTKPPPQEASDAGAAAAAGVAAAGVAAVGVAAVTASNGESDHSNSSFRRSTMRASLSARLLQGGAMKSDEVTENMGGIKILHNPRVSCTVVVEHDATVSQQACSHLTSCALFVGSRLQSERSLQLSGGQELSRNQLMMSLEDNDDDDDDDNVDSENEDEDGSVGVVEQDAGEADVEEAREQQQQQQQQEGDGDVEAGDAGDDQNDKTQPEQSQ